MIHVKTSQEGVETMAHMKPGSELPTPGDGTWVEML